MEKEKIKITLTDSLITNALINWLHEADTDDLARIAGEVFGGECFYENMDDGYSFYPNENYYGQFDPIERR